MDRFAQIFTSMKKYPTLENEEERIKRFNYYGLNNLEKDSELQVFAEAACLITDCASSYIAMMEPDQQTIKCYVGMELPTMPREETFCQYTILEKTPLIIEDTLYDDRTKNKIDVLNGKIRFYAGVPLIDEDGYALGTLCVIDPLPRKLSARQIDSLVKLGESVTNLLISRKKNQYAEYFLDTFQLTNNLICVLDEKFHVMETNPAFDKLFSIGSVEDSNMSFSNFFVEEIDWELISKDTDFSEEGVSIVTKSLINTNLIEINWTIKCNEKKTEVLCFGRNVTKENAEKIKLEKSEKKFRKFFENSIGLMSLHDLDGNIISVNQEGRKALGYTEDELENLNLFQLVDTKNKSMIVDYLERIALDKEAKGMMVLNTKDGSKAYWMYHNMLELDDNNKPYIVSTALNITESILLEKQNKDILQILEQTNDVAQVGGWEYNYKKNSIIWSKSAKDMYGVSYDFSPNFELTEKLFEEESQKKLYKAIEDSRESGVIFDLELELVKYNGSKIWVRVKGIPEMENNKCVRFYGIIQDINDSKKMVLELSTQKAMLQAFIQDVPASVAMFDTNYNFVSVSKQWKDDFHEKNKDVIGTNFFEEFPNITPHRKQIYKHALEGLSYKNDNEVIVDIVDGAGVEHYNWVVKPWMTTSGTIGGVIVFNQNITQSVKINEELKQAKKSAEIASKAKTEFLANMSHEIRTPLNGVIGFSDLLLKTPLNEIQQQYLNYINESGNSLMHIINDILDFSKIESGKLELFVDKYPLSEIGDQVINVVLYQAQRKNIELLLNVQQDLPVNVWIDEARIKQVLMNLLGNAVKFTEAGEIELKIQLLEADDKIAKLRFAVRDTGIGIPVEKQQRIFDAFTQEDSSVSKRYGGTGLGLTISNNILKYMGSTLSLKSEPGIGSVFYFDIEVPYENSVIVEEQTIDLEHVLVVDDNEQNRIILQQMLSFKNIQADLAANGLEAIQLLMKGNQYDAILMDYHMPVLSGIETIDKIKSLFLKQDQKTPLIILHTSSEEQEVVSTMRREENSYCLLKPIKSNELYRMLHKATKQLEIVKDVTINNTQEIELIEEAIHVLIADDNPVNMALNTKIMSEIVPNAVLVQVENGAHAVEQCLKHSFDLILMDIQMPVMDGLEATKIIRNIASFSSVPIIGITAGNVVDEKVNSLNAGMSDLLAKPMKQSDLFSLLKKYFKASVIKSEMESNLSDILDINVLEAQFSGDEKFKIYFLDLLHTELKNSLEQLKEIDQQFSEQNIKQYLHKLKGTAGMSGLKNLLERVAFWEENVSEEDVDAMCSDVYLHITNAIRAVETIKR